MWRSLYFFQILKSLFIYHLFFRFTTIIIEFFPVVINWAYAVYSGHTSLLYLCQEHVFSFSGFVFSLYQYALCSLAVLLLLLHQPCWRFLTPSLLSLAATVSIYTHSLLHAAAGSPVSELRQRANINSQYCSTDKRNAVFICYNFFWSSNTYECFATLINVYLNSVKKMKKVEYRQCYNKTALLQGHEENYNVSYGNVTCLS